MTIADQIKILNKKILQNEAQYHLDRKAAKISALFSNNLDKYEYLAGEVLGLKPNTIEQARFEFSPLGKFFNKGLDKDDKKEGLFKRLENIKNKNEGQLKVLKDQLEKQPIISTGDSLFFITRNIFLFPFILAKHIWFRQWKHIFFKSNKNFSLSFVKFSWI